MVLEEQNLSVNRSHEIQTLKKLMEEAEAEKTQAKQKDIEWEEKYDRVNKRAHEWAKKYGKMRDMDVLIIKDLQKTVKGKFKLVEKWRPKALQSIARLEILHDICPEHAFDCEEQDVIYSVYEAKLPPHPSSSDGNTQV